MEIIKEYKNKELMMKEVITSMLIISNNKSHTWRTGCFAIAVAIFFEPPCSTSKKNGKEFKNIIRIRS